MGTILCSFKSTRTTEGRFIVPWDWSGICCCVVVICGCPLGGLSYWTHTHTHTHTHSYPHTSTQFHLSYYTVRFSTCEATICCKRLKSGKHPEQFSSTNQRATGSAYIHRDMSDQSESYMKHSTNERITGSVDIHRDISDQSESCMKCLHDYTSSKTSK